MRWLRELKRRHDALRDRIHATRFVIENPYLLRAVQGVYMSIPMLFGYYLLTTTTSYTAGSAKEEELRVSLLGPFESCLSRA